MERSAAGALIRQLRDEAGLSQADVGTALTVTPGAVSQWEAGRTMPNRIRGRALDSLLHANGRILDALGYGVVSASGETAGRPPSDVAAELEAVRRALADVEARLARVERSDPPPPAKAQRRATGAARGH